MEARLHSFSPKGMKAKLPFAEMGPAKGRSSFSEEGKAAVFVGFEVSV